MREILFRGKRIDNGEWVEGYLIHDKHDGLYRIVIKLEYSTGTYIVTGFAPRVSVETVGQYTGLTDKNGKKIFEGDIVQFPNLYGSGNGVIECRFGEFKAVVQNYAYTIQGYLEIIGNIHDNPELLKGENNV